MPLREHVRELRNRVLLSAAGVVAGAVLGWIWYPEIFAALQDPIVDIARERGQDVLLNFSGVGTALTMQIQIALFAGALLASPWWIYQLWAFVTPGLTRSERRYTLGFLLAGIPLFLSGAALSWWLLPKAVGILTSFTPEDSVNVIEVQAYLGFIMRMVLAFGLAFLMPAVMVALTGAGVVRARTWLVGWRWAVLLAFVFGAVATPTADAYSMFVLAGPIVVLYFAAFGVGTLLDRRRDRRAALREEAVRRMADGTDGDER